MLGLELMAPRMIDDSAAESMDMECAICYTHALPRMGVVGASEGNSATRSASSSSSPILESSSGNNNTSGGADVQFNLPDQLCSNPKCNRVFHTVCLVQWLQALPSTKSSFGTLFGVCPYCSDALAVKIVVAT